MINGGRTPPFLLQLDTPPKGRVGSSPKELCALAVQEFGHCPSQGASLGWLCEGRPAAGMHGESQAGLDMSTHQGYRGAGRAETEPKVCSEDGSQELCMNSVAGTGSGAAYTEGSGRLSTPKS